MDGYKQYLQEIEDGKNILREKGINFSTFKKELSPLLVNSNVLSEDEWVDYYNNYARGVTCMTFETVKDWANFFFEEYNKKEHRLWLKK